MKIKTKALAFVSLCVLLAGMIFYTGDVEAEEGFPDYNAEQKGSITVHLDAIGTNREGIQFSCYQVGTAKVHEGYLEGFTVDADYASLDLDLNDIEESKKHKAAAEKLTSYLAEHPAIQPVASGKTDPEGMLSFPGLTQGVYLLVQKDGFQTYGTTDPFLISIPHVEETLVLYDVTTETKGALPQEPTGTKTVKTGDDTSVWMWVGLCAIALVVLIVLPVVAGRKRKREVEENAGSGNGSDRNRSIL